MPQTETKKHVISPPEVVALNNAMTLAKGASDALVEHHSAIRKLGDTINRDNFLVREYPGRFNNGCDRGGQRLIYAAHTLDAVQRNIKSILAGNGATEYAPKDDYRGTDPGKWLRGKAFAKPEEVRGALNQFTSHIEKADTERLLVDKITEELSLVKESGVDTALANLKTATEFIDKFKVYLTELGTHAGQVVDAFQAWDDGGRHDKLRPTLPPLRIKIKDAKGRDKGASGDKKGTGTKNHPGGTNKNGGGNTTKTKHKGTDTKSKTNPGGQNGDGKDHKGKGKHESTTPSGRGPDKKNAGQAGLAYALGQLKKGVREVNHSNTGRDVNKYLESTGLGGGYPWCAAFVRWCMEHGGFKFPKGTSWAACEQFQAEAARGGSMYKVGHGDARPGDLIVWGGKHIGIVESRSGGTIHYVAGNQGDAVARGTSAVSDGSYTIIRLRQQ
ncbi:MAG: CHAP domain-containing protein [Herbiconiux sp.]|nr:CHAP domain-containing protein [Herbiconiux sp.]